jgi:hypothetical protein
MELQKKTHRLPEPTFIEDRKLKEYLNSLVKTIRLRLENLDHKNSVTDRNTTYIDVTTTPYALTVDSYIVLVDASSGSIIVNLPPAADVPRLQWTIKKADTSSNTITLTPNGSETIDRNLSVIMSGTSSPSLTIYSDGTEWWII